MNAKGRPIRGVVSAANESDLFAQLQTAGLELISCAPVTKKKASLFGIKFGTGIKIRDLIQLFMHLEQMQGAGVPMLDALADIRDTTENNFLRDLMSEVYRDVSEGGSLSEALANHPRIFGNLYISLIKAGEDTGDLTSSYLQLVKYLKWVDSMQTKIRKAVRYPTILLVFVILAVVVMMGYVVPQIVGFIKNMEMELPWYTNSLIITSEFFQAYWWAVVATPIILFVLLMTFRKLSDEFHYRTDLMALSMPIMGPLIRKINIARYAQTFGALFAAGIDIIQCLKSARSTIGNKALLEALETVQKHVQAGSPLSESLNACGEFPSMVVRMVRIGEESGNLTVVLDQVSEFYTHDVDEAVQALITMIEPMLTLVLGVMILWIAAGVFGPIYSNLGNFGM